MKIAILSDVHGNTIALDAVLNDIQANGRVDEYWVLGDLAAIGYDPVGAIERVAALPNARVIHGNTDRYLVNGHRPGPSLAEAIQDPRLLPTLVETVASFAWTQGALAKTRWLDWLAALPLDHRVTLPDGTRVLLVHASPGTDDGSGMHPGVSDTELELLFRNCDADLVFVGHTHWAADRRAGNARVVNPGSVSNPFPPDLRASYVLLNADATGYRFEHCRVDYDHEAVIDQVKRVRHPAGEYIVRYMRGENISPWMKT
ncbi:MAG: metallophosphoesterase family protein [Chloroflexi bacterium]|nr:metallophosphoesterase family protein [Chloroflexota bacterium]